ncbi:hypothetical protein BH10ACT2_BH10ACT2_12930 [soil metagenome]
MRWLFCLAIVGCIPVSCSDNAANPAESSITESSLAEGPIDLTTLPGRIAFSYDTGVWVSDATGANRVQLTDDGGFDPTFSPDGKRIVYRTLTGADDGELWVMDADGSNLHNIVNDPDFSDWGPAWSPDGTMIAFNSNRLGGHVIWVMDADGSNQRSITRGHGEYPAWSPDSQSIAFAGGSYYDIRRVNVDGSDDALVIGDPAYEMGPAWSPDGKWIAFHTQADFTELEERGMGPEMEIHLIHPDGTGEVRVTKNHVEDAFATWSPDGQYLMWIRHGEIVVARPDGSGLIEIGPGNFPCWIA